MDTRGCGLAGCEQAEHCSTILSPAAETQAAGDGVAGRRAARLWDPGSLSVPETGGDGTDAIASQRPMVVVRLGPA